MRYLGLATLLTLSVLGICLHSLHFTWIARKVEHQAAKHAVSSSGSIDFEKKQAFLKAQENKVVCCLFGMDYTYSQVKQKSLGLGLDLQGGILMVVQIDMFALLKNLAQRSSKNPTFLKALHQAEKEHSNNPKLFTSHFIASYEKLPTARPLREVFTHPDIQSKLSGEATNQQVGKALYQCFLEANKSNIKVYNNRLDKFSVSSTHVMQTPSNDIEIVVPGSNNPDRLKKIIQTPGQLNFYLAISPNEKALNHSARLLYKEIRKSQAKTKAQKMLVSNDIFLVIPQQGLLLCKKEYAPSVSKLLEKDDIQLLLLHDLIISDKSRQAQGQEYYMLYAVQDKLKPILEGSEIKDAKVDFHQGSYCVQLKTNSTGAKKLRKHTGNNIGCLMLIVFNNKVCCAATIQSQIPNGQCNVSGLGSEQEANDLAKISISGIVEKTKPLVQTIIGPTLAKAAQAQGTFAVLLALVLILLFMVLYYGGSGLIASLALIVNAIIILGTLAQLDAALTLPGIAGIMISIGTGIDGSVIIIECIKAEIKKGTPVKTAIINGYHNAYSSIIDSNVTTLLASLALYVFGQGAIKGFATTLTIGTISSCFTSVIVMRLITEAFIRIFGAKRLSFSLFKQIT